MSELTPERIRDAAEVVRLVNEAVGRERDAAQYGSSLDTYALTLKLKLDAEAKREKRIDELVWLMFKRDYPDSNGPTGSGYRKYAEAVIDAFPTIVDGDNDE